ncbi:MAG: discoidin domain-containing protein [Rhodanobacter sp.]
MIINPYIFGGGGGGGGGGGVTSRYVRLNFPLARSGSDAFMCLQRARFSLSGVVLPFSTWPTFSAGNSSTLGAPYNVYAAFTDVAPTAGAVTNGWASDGSGTLPQWLSIDFKTSVNFDEVDIYPDGYAGDIRNPAKVQVQTSPDGTTWTTIWTKSSLTYPTDTWYPVNATTT